MLPDAPAFITKDLTPHDKEKQPSLMSRTDEDRVIFLPPGKISRDAMR